MFTWSIAKGTLENFLWIPLKVNPLSWMKLKISKRNWKKKLSLTSSNTLSYNIIEKVEKLILNLPKPFEEQTALTNSRPFLVNIREIVEEFLYKNSTPFNELRTTLHQMNDINYSNTLNIWIHRELLSDKQITFDTPPALCHA